MVIAEIEPITMLRLIQLHFRPVPLGLPIRIAGRDTIAVTLAFDWRTLNRLSDMRGDRKSVLAESFETPALQHAA
jgi:acyl-homoserine lactone synthase